MNQRKNTWLLTPVFGAIIFVIIYFIAAAYYPGGSQVDKHSTGFSWINNYWCNLLNETAINGKNNPARPIAIFGMFVLCVSLGFFWYIFPIYIAINRTATLAIRIPGVLSMVIAFFLFTHINHDLVTDLASLFGLIATAVVFIGLYKHKAMRLVAFGALNILLVVLNNYLYFSKDLIIYLPLVQKISFASFLLWICLTNIYIYHSAKPNTIRIKD